MTALRTLVIPLLVLGPACKKTTDEPPTSSTQATAPTQSKGSLCDAAATPEHLLDFARRVYGDANAFTLSKTASLDSVVTAAKREGIAAFEQWTGRALFVANEKILDVTLVASDADAWRERVGPLVSSGRPPKTTAGANGLEIVLAQPDAAALGLAVGDTVRVHPIDELETVLDPIEATLVGVHGPNDNPLGDTTTATGFASRPLVAGAHSVGFAAPEHPNEDWVAKLERMPELADFKVLSAASLQQPMVEYLGAVQAVCDQAKPPSGKHVPAPVVPGSCDDTKTWSEDETRLRTLLGDQLGPPTSSGPPPRESEPIALRGGFMFDTAGLLALPIIERSSAGMQRLASFVTDGSLDGLEDRDVPAIALTLSTAAAMGLKIGDSIQLALESTTLDPGERYTVESVELVAIVELPDRLGRMLGAWGWRLRSSQTDAPLEARWYSDPVESSYLSQDRQPLFGAESEQQAQTIRLLCSRD